MVVVEYPKQYKLVRFERSKAKNKKYVAILRHKVTGNYKRVNFGDVRYQHYRDSTPLKLFKHLDHNDSARRKRYRRRHAKTKDNKFSSSWFAYYYLW